jgi:hypothetical protein
MAFQAVFLELFLILTFIIVGVEVLVLLKIQHEPKNILYFAPILGLSTIVLIVFFFNRIGIPVNHISKILFPLIYILLCIKFSSIKRMISRQFINVVLVTVLGLQLTFWPLLKNGFKWVSYANDDMTNYVLAAQRFYSNGFFDKIDFSNFLGGKEYSEEYFFMHVTSGVRPGSELLLAFNSFLTSGDSLKVFMVTIASLQFVLTISVVALMITIQKISAKKQYLLVSLLSIFPLISLGSLYQLIGQVGGIAFSVGIYGLALLAIRENGVLQKRIHIVLTISLASLLIWYPEILPFTLLPILIVVAHSLRHRLIRTNQIVKLAMFTILFLVVFLNKYLLEAIQFLNRQSSNSAFSDSSQHTNATVFPYYLIPNGLPSLFGLSPFHKIANEPIASALIIVATLLSLLIIFSVMKLPKQNGWVTIPFLIYTSAALILFFQKSDFGLFKLAMFMAPWLVLILFNIYIFLANSKIKTYKVPVLLVSALPIIALMVTTQMTYSSASVYSRGGLQEISNATTSNLVGQIDSALSKYNSKMGNLAIDTTNQPTAKLFMLRGKGIPVFFPVANYMLISDPAPSDLTPQLADRSFSHSFSTQLGINTFEIPKLQISYKNSKDTYVLSNNGGDSIFNRTPSSADEVFSILKNPTNYLIYKDSKLGPMNLVSRTNKSKIVLWRLERDPMMPNSEMGALGKVILMQALNPTPNARLKLEMSSTALEQSSRTLPKAGISGAKNSSFDIVGRGSARVLSTVVVPYEVSGLKFLQLNFFAEGKYFENIKRGLNSLYNKEVSLDPRKIVTFGRAINLTNRSEALFDAPVSVSSFPKDLENEELLYSGIYESGWLSEDSYFYLKSSNKNDSLKLTGFVPLIKNKDFATNVKITIDGKRVAKRNLQVGDFEFNLDALGIKPGVHRVGIHFDKYQNIQGKQELFAAGFLRQLGFSPTS